MTSPKTDGDVTFALETCLLDTEPEVVPEIPAAK